MKIENLKKLLKKAFSDQDKLNKKLIKINKKIFIFQFQINNLEKLKS